MERLTTEVMQLREFLPRVLTGDLTETLRRALTTLTCEYPRIVFSCCLGLNNVKTQPTLIKCLDGKHVVEFSCLICTFVNEVSALISERNSSHRMKSCLMVRVT